MLSRRKYRVKRAESKNKAVSPERYRVITDDFNPFVPGTDVEALIRKYKWDYRTATCPRSFERHVDVRTDISQSSTLPASFKQVSSEGAIQRKPRSLKKNGILDSDLFDKLKESSVDPPTSGVDSITGINRVKTVRPQVKGECANDKPVSKSSSKDIKTYLSAEDLTRSPKIRGDFKSEHRPTDPEVRKDDPEPQRSREATPVPQDLPQPQRGGRRYVQRRKESYGSSSLSKKTARHVLNVHPIATLTRSKPESDARFRQSPDVDISKNPQTVRRYPGSPPIHRGQEFTLRPVINKDNTSVPTGTAKDISEVTFVSCSKVTSRSEISKRHEAERKETVASSQIVGRGKTTLSDAQTSCTRGTKVGESRELFLQSADTHFGTRGAEDWHVPHTAKDILVGTGTGVGTPDRLVHPTASSPKLTSGRNRTKSVDPTTLSEATVRNLEYQPPQEDSAGVGEESRRPRHARAQSTGNIGTKFTTKLDVWLQPVHTSIFMYINNKQEKVVKIGENFWQAYPSRVGRENRILPVSCGPVTISPHFVKDAKNKPRTKEHSGVVHDRGTVPEDPVTETRLDAGEQEEDFIDREEKRQEAFEFFERLGRESAESTPIPSPTKTESDVEESPIVASRFKPPRSRMDTSAILESFHDESLADSNQNYTFEDPDDTLDSLSPRSPSPIKTNGSLSPQNTLRPSPDSSNVSIEIHNAIDTLDSAIALSSQSSVDSGLNSDRQQGHFVVVAIDFGTTYSGYAFSFTRDPSSIHMMRKWEGGDPGVINQKTPTTLLLTPEERFHSFGFTARDHFHDLDPQEAKKWLYFEKFKMLLHHDPNLNDHTMIMSSNGKGVAAVTVFSHALMFFKQHALQELSDQSTIKILNEDVRWVITVPAIWKQPAKQFMREAAYKAGIASSEIPDQLLIALEPEAASIYCRRLRMYQLVPEAPVKRPLSPKKENLEPMNMDFACEQLRQGTRYMVVDCGGGTVDITVHQLDENAGKLRELHKATGGPYGSVGVDREFELLLIRIFGQDFIDQFRFKRPAGFVDLMIAFESRKRAASPYKENPLNVSLPFSFIDYYKKSKALTQTLRRMLSHPQGCPVEVAVRRYNEKYNDKDIRWSSQGMLRLNPEAMRRLFQPTLEKIVEAVGEVLNHPDAKDTQYIFLVGGFSESPILQNVLRKEFGHLVKLIIPQDMGLTILKGAVLFGLDPTIVSLRKSRLTYGVGVLNRFNYKKHPKDKLVKRDGVEWCTDVFDKFVSVNQPVALGDTVLRSYTPAKPGQKQSIINIYCTDREKADFITDKGVKICGTLQLDLSDTHYQSIPKRREIQARMLFGDTEIKVSALDVATGRCVKAAIDFLNK